MRNGLWRCLEFKPSLWIVCPHVCWHAEQATSSNAGAKLPSCGDEGRAAFDAISKLTLVFKSMKSTAVVNGDEWMVIKGRSRTVAAKELTNCTSLSLGFRSQDSVGIGVLVYVSRCPERPACASVADYKGTYSSK